jgi:hypothetical protein
MLGLPDARQAGLPLRPFVFQSMGFGKAAALIVLGSQTFVPNFL